MRALWGPLASWWLLLGAAVLLLSGCASSAPSWNRPGATAQDFAVDRYRCTQESRVGFSATGGLVWVAAANAAAENQSAQLFQQCMEAHGWMTGSRSPIDAVLAAQPLTPEERLQVTGENDPGIPSQLCSDARLSYLMARYPERFATEFQECRAYQQNRTR